MVVANSMAMDYLGTSSDPSITLAHFDSDPVPFTIRKSSDIAQSNSWFLRFYSTYLYQLYQYFAQRFVIRLYYLAHSFEVTIWRTMRHIK